MCQRNASGNWSQTHTHTNAQHIWDRNDTQIEGDWGRKRDKRDASRWFDGTRFKCIWPDKYRYRSSFIWIEVLNDRVRTFLCVCMVQFNWCSLLFVKRNAVDLPSAHIQHQVEHRFGDVAKWVALKFLFVVANDAPTLAATAAAAAAVYEHNSGNQLASTKSF